MIGLDLRNNQIKVGELLDDPPARAVFQKRFGTLMNHPMLSMARTLSLAQLIGFAQTYVSKTVISETLRELQAL